MISTTPPTPPHPVPKPPGHPAHPTPHAPSCAALPSALFATSTTRSRGTCAASHAASSSSAGSTPCLRKERGLKGDKRAINVVCYE